MASLHLQSAPMTKSPEPGTRIQLLAGLDGSLLDQVVVRKTAFIAELLQAGTIVFLQVYEPEPIHEGFTGEFRKIARDTQKDMLTAMKETVEEHFPQPERFRVDYEVRSGSRTSEFMALCEERNFHTVVLGRKKSLPGQGILGMELARFGRSHVLLVPERTRSRLKNIMVCNDFSHFSQLAMEQAVMLATKDEADITVYSQHIYSFPGADNDPDMLQYQQDFKEKMTGRYNNFIQKVDLGEVHVAPLFTVDSIRQPHLAICREAQRKNVDLLVIGSRLRSANAPDLLSTVTEKVLRHMEDIPVLVVKPRPDFLH